MDTRKNNKETAAKRKNKLRLIDKLPSAKDAHPVGAMAPILSARKREGNKNTQWAASWLRPVGTPSGPLFALADAVERGKFGVV
jgi:hypothetical protein